MKEYRVSFEQTVFETTYVEAESEEEAIAKAIEDLNDEQEMNSYTGRIDWKNYDYVEIEVEDDE